MSSYINGKAVVPTKTALVDRNVLFYVDGTLRQIVSVKNGDSVSKPNITVLSNSQAVTGWKDEGNNLVTFPFTPVTENTKLTAVIETVNVFDGVMLIHFDGSLNSAEGVQPLVSGTPTFVAGKFGNGIASDNSTWLTYTSTSIPFNNSATYEFWFKQTGAYVDKACAFSWYDANNYPSNSVGACYVHPTEIYIYKGGKKTTATVALSQDVWYHIAFVFTPNGTRIYLNGTKVADDSTFVQTVTANGIYILGNKSTEKARNSVIDEFAVFNYEKYTEDFTPNSLPYYYNEVI